MALRNKRNGQHVVSYTPQQSLPEVPAIPVIHKHPRCPKESVLLNVIDEIAVRASQYASGILTEKEFRFYVFSALGKLFGF